MRNLFKSSSVIRGIEPKVPRNSSGWADLYKHLQMNESLRVLDVGATSANNINFLTNLGHSVYMANFVEDAARPEWQVSVEDQDGTAKSQVDIGRFLTENLDFAGREFDVILLWDTLDYLPVELVGPIVSRLCEKMAPGGKLLGFFHTKMQPGDATFARYHLTGENVVEMQRTGSFPMVQVFQNRQVERLFHEYSNYRFFLAKDSLQEVIVTR